MQEHLVPVVPLEGRAIHPHNVRRAVVAAHDTQGDTNIVQSNDTAHDGIICLHIERYVAVFLRAAGHGAAIVVEHQEPVPLPGGGRKRRFPAETARRDCRLGWEHDRGAQPDLVRLVIPRLPRLPQEDAVTIGCWRCVSRGSDGHTSSSASRDVRVMPERSRAVRVPPHVGARAEVPMGPLREIPRGQVASEKNGIPACFVCVGSITCDLRRDTEQ